VADPTDIKDATGTTVSIATDEIADASLGAGNYKFQYVKIVDGDLNGTTKYGQTNPFPVQGKQSALTSGTITTATSTVTVAAATGYNVATVGITGTYAGVSFVFEGSPDGTNWFTLQGQQTDTGAAATTVTSLTNVTRAWDIFVGAWAQFRVRATAWASGTVTVLIMLQSMPTEPVPTVVQQRDPARGHVTYYTLIPVAGSSSDTLLSLTGTKNGATVTATTTPAVVTAGKNFFCQRFTATFVATSTSVYAVVRLRFNTNGTVVIGSPVAASIYVGAGTPGTANSTGIGEAPLPDGLFFPAGTGVGISAQTFTGTTATSGGLVAAAIGGFEF
jgi:hypothetical protein